MCPVLPLPFPAEKGRPSWKGETPSVCPMGASPTPPSCSLGQVLPAAPRLASLTGSDGRERGIITAATLQVQAVLSAAIFGFWNFLAPRGRQVRVQGCGWSLAGVGGLWTWPTDGKSHLKPCDDGACA